MAIMQVYICMIASCSCHADELQIEQNNHATTLDTEHKNNIVIIIIKQFKI